MRAQFTSETTDEQLNEDYEITQPDGEDIRREMSGWLVIHQDFQGPTNLSVHLARLIDKLKKTHRLISFCTRRSPEH